MPITKLTPETAYPYEENRLSALQQVVPEAFTDGKIDWEILREVLGEYLEDEDAREEHFGLSWPGKREARKLAAQPSKGTLVPCPGEGINEEDTENIFIEGDNLEVLKILLKSYAGKIKMIYIDPPYNTGNDFIYNDDFADPLEAYLEYTGAKGEGGELLTTNTRADGRFHSKWLNMMYPRLILARQLLRDDGVIFISIDDNEVHNLRQLMNEIFGEENFVASIIWQKKFARQNDAVYFSTMHDYILSFAKVSSQHDNVNSFDLNLLPRTEESNEGYNNPDNDKRGAWTSVVLSAKSGSEKLRYKIITPSGRECFPPDGRYWSVSEEKFWNLVKDNRIWFGKSGNGIPRLKTFLSEVQSGLKPNTIWFHDEVSHNQAARQKLKELFNGEAVFDSPKPVELLMQMIHISSNNNDEIFMDFFSGSGTLAEAVMLKNKEDNKKRKFILVQIPELADSTTYKTIADITKDRIRRASERERKKQPGLFAKANSSLDTGFKVYSLSQAWLDNEIEEDLATVTQVEFEFENAVKSTRKDEDVASLITEIILYEGFPLTSTVIYFEEIQSNEVYQVTAEGFCNHDLFICLDEEIRAETIPLLPMDPKHDIFVCRDSALSDEVKARLIDQYTVHVV